MSLMIYANSFSNYFYYQNCDFPEVFYSEFTNWELRARLKTKGKAPKKTLKEVVREIKFEEWPRIKFWKIRWEIKRWEKTTKSKQEKIRRSVKKDHICEGSKTALWSSNWFSSKMDLKNWHRIVFVFYYVCHIWLPLILIFLLK